MKKHELEAEIDRIKLMKELKEDIGDYPPAKAGRPPAREIPTATTKVGEVEIKLPKVPAERLVEPYRRKVGRPPKKAEEDLFPGVKPGSALATESPAIAKAAAIVAERKLPVSRASHICNCPLCPQRDAVVSFKGPTTLTL